MTEKNYKLTRDYFLSHKNALKTLKFLYKFLPLIVVISFAIVAALIIINFRNLNSGYIFRTIITPAIVFAFVTIFRKVFNFQRPYEKYNLSPVINKDKKGHSFPSRHVASGVIIAMSFLYVNMILGIVFLFIAFVIALTRVLSGVHFIRDVIAGALFSLISGLILIFII